MSFLQDPWQLRRIPLDGFVERHHFAPWFMAIIVLLVALIAFQFVVAPLTIIGLLLARGTEPTELLNEVLRVMEGDSEVLLIANTVGQVFGLALPVLFFTRLSSTRSLRFLRLRGCSVALLGLSLLGLAALIPIVDFAGSMNNALPWPESVRDFERLMMEPVERYLSDRGNLIPGLIMISLAPAVCEELLFRGYVQRQAERSMGIWKGIAFTGIIFGMYHLQPTKVLPLSLLGLYMAYLTWRTGSLWPAVLVHFANNAFAVVVSIFFLPGGSDATQDIEQLNLPFYFVVAGVVVFACSIYLIESLSQAALEKVGARRAEAEAYDTQEEVHDQAS